MAALAATTTVGYGVLFYAYGVLLVPMEQDLGWSRSFLTGAFSGALLVGALLTVVVGRWLDHHAPRPLFMAGALSATVLLVLWAGSRGRPAFIAVWVLLGACQAVLFYEPAFTVLTKWFSGPERHRALTAVTLLAGLASTIFGPLTAALERAFGWRGAVVALAAILGAVTVPAFLVGLRDPRRAPAADEVERADGPADPSPSQALATVQFWLLTGAYLLSSVTTFAVIVHLVPYLLDRGLGAGVAASALGGIGLVQVLGRSMFSRLAARWPALRLGTWVLMAKAVGLSLLLIVPGLVGVLVFVVVYGAANGISTLARATAVAELYGARHYGAISAVVAAVSSVGGAVAPFLAAAAIAAVGNDEPVLWALVAISVLAALANTRVAGSTRVFVRRAVTPDHSEPVP